MTFNPDEIFQITANIWETAIALHLEPGEPAAVTNRARSTAACIQITGAWNGAILLDCPAEVARMAGSAMFDTDLTNVTVDEMQDAIAELVNMIGGNFKALLPETCYLSLPSVVEGGDYSARVPGSVLLGKVPFSCDGHAMSITVLEKIKQQTIAA